MREPTGRGFRNTVSEKGLSRWKGDGREGTHGTHGTHGMQGTKSREQRFILETTVGNQYDIYRQQIWIFFLGGP